MKRDATLGATTGMLALLAATYRDATGHLMQLRFLVLGAALGVAVISDIRERRIPNRIVLPAAAACAGVDGLTSATTGLFPAVAMVLALSALAFAKPSALGMGDIKLALLIALAIPARAVWALVVGLLLAVAAGTAWAAIRSESPLHTRVALAPFLAAATVIALT